MPEKKAGPRPSNDAKVRVLPPLSKRDIMFRIRGIPPSVTLLSLTITITISRHCLQDNLHCRLSLRSTEVMLYFGCILGNA